MDFGSLEGTIGRVRDLTHSVLLEFLGTAQVLCPTLEETRVAENDTQIAYLYLGLVGGSARARGAAELGGSFFFFFLETEPSSMLSG